MQDWFFIALLSPAIFALITILDDNLLRQVYKSPFFGAIISGFFGMLPLVGILFYPIVLPSLPVILCGVLAGMFTVISYYFYFKGLEVEAPSVVIALFSLAPAFIPFLSYLVLGEILTVNQYIGFVIVLIASYILASVDIKKFTFSPALFVIGIGAIIYAVIAVMGKYVYQSVDFWTGYMLFACGMGLGAVFLSLSFAKGREFFHELKTTFRKWIVVFILVELLGISAELTNNIAISRGPVSLVKVIESTQPIFVLFYALLFFGWFPLYLREALDTNRVKKISMMLLMGIGLYFIYQS